jgi:dCTP deaminase
MVLSNVEIVNALNAGEFKIDGLASRDPSEKPFNTSAVDLRLGDEIRIPECKHPVTLDLRKGNIAGFWAANTRKVSITDDQPFVLPQGKLVLANTFENVDFPIREGGKLCYSARVEGKSSLARCGILVHFTAPTIHAGFEGKITLEMINLGCVDFLLFPGMPICQLIIEEVKGCPTDAPNQFKGQQDPVGRIAI